MSFDPGQLDEFLSRIKTEFNHPDIIANPFLFLVKPTEENLKKYMVSKPESRFWFGVCIAGVLPTIFVKVAYSAAISVIRISENRNWNVDSVKKTRNLYISHFTYAQLPQNDDVFFGKNTQDPEDLVFYLNSTRENGFETQKKFLALGKKNVIFNTKSLGLIQTLVLHMKQASNSFKFFLSALTNSSYTQFQRRLLLKFSIAQHSRETMANLSAKVRLKEVVSKSHPENIILTIEGHAHEAMVISFRDTDFPNVRIVGFQHAPIVPGQFSLYRFLRAFNSRDLILTSGLVTREMISKHNPNLQTKILGSPKSIEAKLTLKGLSTMNVLGAVEGTSESLKSFILLFNKLSDLLPDINFVIRNHPALSGNVAKKLLKSLSGSPNLSVSTASLTEDLSNSHITIFRSSAVGLEGLAFASLPVHFDAETMGLLNPLSQVNYPKFEFSDVNQLANFLQKWPLTRNNSPRFRAESSQIISDYYFPMQDVNSLIG